MIEQWRDVPGWEGVYQVSDTGQVRSVTRRISGSQKCCPTRVMLGRVLRAGLSGKNKTYRMVSLTSPGRKRECRYVHDLVLAAFKGPKPPGLEVCHGQAGQQNNSLSNLRYDTRSANAQDRLLFGKPHPKKECKPPTERQCAVCQQVIWERKRRTAVNLLCKDPRCRSEWGRIVQARRK